MQAAGSLLACKCPGVLANDKLVQLAAGKTHVLLQSVVLHATTRSSQHEPDTAAKAPAPAELADHAPAVAPACSLTAADSTATAALFSHEARVRQHDMQSNQPYPGVPSCSTLPRSSYGQAAAAQPCLHDVERYPALTAASASAAEQHSTVHFSGQQGVLPAAYACTADDTMQHPQSHFNNHNTSFTSGSSNNEVGELGDSSQLGAYMLAILPSVAVTAGWDKESVSLKVFGELQ
jgi:hypothetical protein